ncbi:hypothetical protein D3C78_1466430 [compost metagenome]
MGLVESLAHRQQAHTRRVAADPQAGIGDSLLNGGQVAAKILDRVGLRVAPVALVQGQGVSIRGLLQKTGHQLATPLLLATSTVGLATGWRRGSWPLSTA